MSTYGHFLEKTLTEERDFRSIREDRSAQKRISKYESDCKKDAEAAIEEAEKKKNQEIEEMNKRTEEAIAEVAKKMSNEKEKFDEKVKEIETNAKLELAKKLKVYEEIIEKNKKILDKEKIAVEKKLLETDGELRDIRKGIKEASLHDADRLEDKRVELVRAQREKEEGRHLEVLNAQNEMLEERKNNKLEVSKKDEEHHDRRMELHNDLEQQNTTNFRVAFQTITLNSNRYDANAMNGLLERLGERANNVQNGYEQCLRNFQVDEHEWNHRKIERAKRSFADYSSETKNLQQTLNAFAARLAEFYNDSERAEKFEKIREIRQVLYELSNCIAKFSGRFDVGNMKQNKEQEKELGKLMDTFYSMINSFGHFRALRNEMVEHLRPDGSSLEKASEKKQIEF